MQSQVTPPQSLKKQTQPLTPNPPAVKSNGPSAEVKKPDSNPTTPQPANRHKAVMRVKMGTRLFDSGKGEILTPSYVWLSTDRFHEAKIILFDPDDKIRQGLEADKQQDIEIEIGFADGERKNKFIGKIREIGRKPPTGTIVIAADPSSQMKQQSGPVAVFNSDQPNTPDAQSRKVTPEQDAFKQIREILQKAEKTVTIVTLHDIQAVIKRVNLPQDEKLKQVQTILKTENNPVEAGKKIGSIVAVSETTSAAETSNPPVKAGGTPSPGMSGILDLLSDTSKSASPGKPNTPASEQFALNTTTNLKFLNQSRSSDASQGKSILQQMRSQTAALEAIVKGDAITVEGNTVKQVPPGGGGEPSGLVLDYVSKRAVFVREPEVSRWTGMQLNSGLGSTTVTGWSVNDKKMVGATVVLPADAPAHPTGSIVVPDWGQIKLSDPIFPGCPYTWNDATKNGTRVPSKQIMGRIVAIATAITPLTEKTVGKGKRWSITSWYRDPASNAAAGGATQSRHMVGDAMDFYFEVNGGEQSLHKALYDTWDGGLAVKPGQFVHIDVGGRGRWVY